MRRYVLTEREEGVLRSYLKRGEKSLAFYDLVYRMRKALPKIREHHDLMERALDRFNGEHT